MKKTVAVLLMLVLVLAASALAADKAIVSGQITLASQIKNDELYYDEMTEDKVLAIYYDISLCKDLTDQLPGIENRIYIVGTVQESGTLYYVFFQYDDSTWYAGWADVYDVNPAISEGASIYPVYKEEEKTVSTGDSTPVMLLGGLMLLGAFGMVALKRKKA